MREIVVYAGTYTRRLPHVDGHGEGIYRLRLDADTGVLACDGVAARLDNPTFLALDPAGRRLYAVSEADETAGEPGGALHAFAISAGALAPLNWQRTGGAASCHLAVDRAGRCVLTANYNGGSVTVLPVGDDGGVARMTHLARHAGAGPNPIRQMSPHPHGVYFDRSEHYLFVPDLGADKVFVYELEAEGAALRPSTAIHPWAALHPGAGPRHLALHPNGRWVYCANELDATASVLAFESETGRLVERGWLSLLPADDAGPSSGAEIAIDAAGRFIYASLRGCDCIAICAVAAEDGALTLIGHEPTLGRTPRHFALSPDDRLLVAANQDSDTLVSFHVDPETGSLTPTGCVVEVPSPVCVLMVT